MTRAIDLVKLTDELKRLDGEAPYNTPSNYCYGDAYYGNSIESKYGMKLEELRKLLNGRRK